ncbi:MAG: ABC transporter ATP-binding protein, partial [Acidobacteriota bacterium]
MTGMLAAYSLWLPFLLVGSALPGLRVVGGYVLREHEWRMKNTVNERRTRYYDWMLTERTTAAEVRAFESGSYHLGAFRRLREQLHYGRILLARKEMKTELAAGAVTWLGGLSGMAWMILRASRGLARLGDRVLCYQAFQQGQKLLRSLLESAGKLYRSTLFLDNLFQLMVLRPQLVEQPKCVPMPGILREGIRFENVAFRYPGNERAALKEFSLLLPTGRVTAIVGHNGAGKST